MANRIIDTKYLSQYKPSEYHKVGNTIILNNGVPIKKGTTEVVQLATIYGPSGKKEEVVVGSKYAADLQAQGWNTKGNGGYQVPKAAAGASTGAGNTGAADSTAGTKTTKAPDITAPPPPKSLFKDSAAYKALPQASKDFIDISYNLISFGSEEEATNFSNAIKAAKDIADPYFAAQMTIAQGDIELQIARANNDYEVQTEIAKRTRDDLKALLTNQKDYFDLQQTADMAKELDNYNNDLLTIASNAADKGLTFATGELSRQRVEDLRKTQYQDVVQSDTRLYNQRINELTMKAAQGDAEAAAKLAELNKGHTTSLEGIGRTAEQILGSGGLGNIAAQTGYTPVGGVPGSLEENKNTAILRDTNAFLDLQKGPNLQNNT